MQTLKYEIVEHTAVVGCSALETHHLSNDLVLK